MAAIDQAQRLSAAGSNVNDRARECHNAKNGEYEGCESAGQSALFAAFGSARVNAVCCDGGSDAVRWAA
ncbi:hypothetical protein C4J92_2813 [Pseudomonas sp. R3-18-08]|nr:hypothetical protein C4J92_2813 [Pseudomonas sp. R3-18-08]